jgi:hypothetical protein
MNNAILSPTCERPFRLIAEVALRRCAVERPLEVELGDWPRSDLEAPGRNIGRTRAATSPEA